MTGPAAARDAFAEPGADPDRAALLVAVLREEARRHEVPSLSVAIVRHDRLLHSATVGLADLGSRTPATPHTSYLWFSMSKIATATAAVALAEAGGLDLDAPITTYLPGYPSGRPVVRQLLDHTAGLGNPLPIGWVHPADGPGPDPRAFLWRRLRGRTPTRHRVGGPAHYSNVGYLVLGEVLRRAAGEPVTDLVTRTVLHPAGMRRTGYVHPGDGSAATGYVRLPRPATAALRLLLPDGILGPRHGRHQALHPFVVDGPAYGGLIGPATDAARLAALHLADGRSGEHRILSPGAARRMRTATARGRRRDFGQGWFRSAGARGTGPAHVEHLGSGAGFHNLMRIYPGLDLGVVIMTNATNAPDLDRICAAATALDRS
ncbi:serine hydrolase domain-containing protein [Pseudonocardia sp.]|uniref:serine hydrolase domain-containing protein n=1 Tax=Pseudonocardia sp. TaxID=60912 RepID=UPI003D0DB9EB